MSLSDSYFYNLIDAAKYHELSGFKPSRPGRVEIGYDVALAAAATLPQSNLEQSSKDVTVSPDDVFKSIRSFPLGLTLQKLVDEHLLRGEGRYFIVLNGGEPPGLVTLNEITTTPRENWTSDIAGQVMIPN